MHKRSLLLFVFGAIFPVSSMAVAAAISSLIFKAPQIANTETIAILFALLVLLVIFTANYLMTKLLIYKHNKISFYLCGSLFFWSLFLTYTKYFAIDDFQIGMVISLVFMLISGAGTLLSLATYQYKKV